MKRDAIIFIKHILNSINDIERSTKSLSEGSFKKNKDVQDATIRRLEIIGEAVKNLPSDFKNKYSDVPWNKIAGMRDKLMHHYFGVDLVIVWNVVEDDLPKLKKDIKQILDKKELK
ncbi:hypothetical protein CMI46_00735 [Candidatus Pacearchaeota archaeon]|nr:hypothetical protein [Candidatus Pacearchaeota archaeon]|tara:strand:+ start:373 stop:720 length:348 start_codon:yes stop_codon:yes gene_type:complete